MFHIRTIYLAIVTSTAMVCFIASTPSQLTRQDIEIFIKASKHYADRTLHHMSEKDKHPPHSTDYDEQNKLVKAATAASKSCVLVAQRSQTAHESTLHRLSAQANVATSDYVLNNYRASTASTPIPSTEEEVARLTKGVDAFQQLETEHAVELLSLPADAAGLRQLLSLLVQSAIKTWKAYQSALTGINTADQSTLYITLYTTEIDYWINKLEREKYFEYVALKLHHVYKAQLYSNLAQYHSACRNINARESDLAEQATRVEQAYKQASVGNPNTFTSLSDLAYDEEVRYQVRSVAVGLERE